MFNNHLMKVCLAAVFAIGLAACSSSSDNGSAGTTEPPPPTQAEQDLEELQNEIAALRAQLGISDDADIGDSIDDLMAERDRLQMQLDDAADAADAAAKKAAAAEAEALFTGLDTDRGTAGTDDLALASLAVTQTYGEAAEVAAATTVAVDGGTPTTPEVEATDTMVATQGMWKGTELFADTNGRMPSNTVVVYTDVMADERVAFAEVYTAATEDGLTIVPAEHAGLIASPEFDHTGLKVHGDPDEADDDIEFRGTFDDAPGKYTCGETGAGTCTSNATNAGMVLSGDWVFVPDVNAMVSQADGGYAYFGWWLYQDSMGPEVEVFHGNTGTLAAVDETRFTALGGTATYTGAAAGKYAIDPVAPGTYASGGHWTADVELTANFETEADGVAGNGSISGMIDGFMAGDTAMDDWSVELGEAPLVAAGTWTSTGDGATTAGDDVVWTIADEAAPEAGMWSGQLWGQTAPPDGNDVPSTATGQFTATYSEGGHTIGQMIGAFGAHE